MVGVAPAARPAPPVEMRELGAAGLAVARRGDTRDEGHRGGRGHRLERVSVHGSAAGENAPRIGKPRRGNARGGRTAAEVAEQGEKPGVVDRDVSQERLELLVVAPGHRADRVEGREDQRLLVGREVDVQDGDGRLAAGQREGDPGVAVDDEPVRRLTSTCWTQPTASSAPARASCCAFGWIRQFAGLARSWSGASSPDPVIRLRQPVVGATAAGAFAVTGRPPIDGLALSGGMNAC